jgi:hypothetical protein
MYASLWPALAAFLLLCVALLLVRVRQEIVAKDLDDAWVRLGEVDGARAPRGETA